MVCVRGRPRLSQDQDRQLFSVSGGTCLLCHTSLFPKGSKRSIPIAERAHIVAHSPDAARGDEVLPEDLRKDPSNIVLLCPTCHTKADKEPDDYPVDLLRKLKAARESAVEAIGGTPIFGSRREARRAVKTLLERSQLLFEQYGPGDEGSLGDAEAVDRWSEAVLGEIVPNNRLVVALVGVNKDLASEADRRAAELIRQHTDDLDMKHQHGVTTGRVARFPANEAAALFDEED